MGEKIHSMDISGCIFFIYTHVSEIAVKETPDTRCRTMDKRLSGMFCFNGSYLSEHNYSLTGFMENQAQDIALRLFSEIRL